jgi:hypothetical protein
LILGNPLIAITTAGLFAPVEILVTEKKSGAGTTITYVRSSSLMVIEDNSKEAQGALNLLSFL